MLLNSYAGLASKVVLSSYFLRSYCTYLSDNFLYFYVSIFLHSLNSVSCLSIRKNTVATMKDRHTDDDAQLAAMGHKAELQRNYSML